MTELLSLVQEIIGLLSLGAQDGQQMAIAPLVAAGALSVASSIGNAIFGSRSAEKQRQAQLEALRKQRAENRAWYNRRYNEDATQTASAQLMMRRANDAIKKRTQAALGKKNVIGGTGASMATTQQANAEAMGNALGDIVANAEARKDNIEAQYRSQDQQLANEETAVNADAEASKRNAVAQAASGAIQTAGSIIANYGDTAGKGTTAKTTMPKVKLDRLTKPKSWEIYDLPTEDFWQQEKSH